MSGKAKLAFVFGFISLSMLTIASLAISLYTLSRVPQNVVTQEYFDQKLAQVGQNGGKPSDSPAPLPTQAPQTPTQVPVNTPTQTPVKAAQIKLTAVNDAGGNLVKKCGNFFISWTASDVNASSCKVAHKNLQNPGGTDLTDNFNEIYGSSRKQGFSVCDLSGKQSFTLSCNGTDGKAYTDEKTLEFSSEF